MLAYKIPLTISAGVVGAYALPPSTNQLLLLAQAVFGICVCFALFLLLLHAAEHRDPRRSRPKSSRAGRHPVARVRKPRHAVPR